MLGSESYKQHQARKNVCCFSSAVMRGVRKFWSMTDRVHDSVSVGLQWGLKIPLSDGPNIIGQHITAMFVVTLV